MVEVSAWRVIAVIGLLTVLGACSDTSTDGGTPTPGETSATTSTGTTTAEETGEPTTEGTGPETAQPKQNKPSVTIAPAPVGGAPVQDGALQCVAVTWSDPPLPDGATATLGSPGLANADDPTKEQTVFALDQSACDGLGGGRPCEGVVWRRGSTEPCSVGVRQVANDGPNVSVAIPADVTCTTQKICDDLKRESSGSDAQFSPGDIEISPSASPSEQPSPDETSTPPEETPTSPDDTAETTTSSGG